jgi:hypothetical protein
MRNYLLSAIGSLALLSAISFTSCQEDRCKSVVCANSGTCNEDGSCTCPVGYEGDRCEVITRDRFKGTWDVHESGSSTGPIRYAVAIENGTNIDQVEIRNFYNLFNTNIVATVKGDTLYIPVQNVEDGDDLKTVEGKGFFDKTGYYGLQGNMILRYKVRSSDGSVNNFGMDGADNPSRWSK